MQDRPQRKPALPAARLLQWFFGIGLVVAVTVVATHMDEERALLDLFRRISPGWLLVALGLQLGTYLADANTLRVSLARAGWRRPLRTLVSLSFAKLFMDQAVPSGGFSGTLLVLQGLQRRGVPRGITLAAVIVDLIAYYASYLSALLVALGVAAALHGLTAWVLLPTAVFTLIALLVISGLLVLAFRGHGALPGWLRRRRGLAVLLADLQTMPREFFRDARLFALCFTFEFAIFICDASTLWSLLYALGEASPPALVFAAFMLATLARTIGIVPGGLGTFEGVSVSMLHLMGVPLATALAATLCFRGLSFWLPLAPGLLLARRESNRSSEFGTHAMVQRRT